MPIQSLSIGANAFALLSVSTGVTSETMFISRVRDSGMLAWTYEPGTNKPTAVSLALQISPDNISWQTIDGISDPTIGVIRQVPLGRPYYIRVKVLSVTIGGGDPFSSRLLV